MNVSWISLTLVLIFGSLCHCHKTKGKEEKEIEILEELVDVLQRQNLGNAIGQVRQAVRDFIEEAKEVGKEYLQRDFELKYAFLQNGTDTLENHTMLSYNDFTPTEAEHFDNETTVSTQAYSFLLTRISNSIFKQAFDDNQDVFLEEWEKVFCPDPESSSCSRNERFREITGHCNNLQHPYWGNSFTAHIRLLDPVYQDEHGLFGPKTQGKTGCNLPSPREVSLKLLQADPADSTLDDNEFTVAVPAMGQFIDHDCTETPPSAGYYGAEIGCGAGSSRFQCFDIDISDDDPNFEGPYMEFTRSSGALTDYCAPEIFMCLKNEPIGSVYLMYTGPRQQPNSLTSFIDASNVYGNEDERAESLWDHNTGLLLVEFSRLPPMDAEDSCILHGDNDDTTYCFRTGDERGNEMTHLSIMHTLFIRYHNTIATGLRSLNPNWNPSRVYEESRRIVGAVFQHLTFNHWLRFIIGDDLMEEYDLTSSSPYRYDPDLNPGTTSAFITAAFRFGHTLVQATEGLVDSDYEFVSEELLEEIFFNPRLVFENASQAARFVITKPMKASDRFVTDQLTNHLFQEGNKSLDLMSLNIQRGRDHALPGYLAYRRLLGIDEDAINSFDDLPSHTPEAIEILKSLYDDVEDIDLFAGGLSERVLNCGLIGETFARIIAEQFHRFKYGDRYFYQNDDIGPNGRHSFTAEQIESIENVSFSRLFCVEYDLSHIQPNVFKKIHPISNNLQQCADYDDQDLDLDLWDESPNGNGGGNAGSGGGNNGR